MSNDKKTLEDFLFVLQALDFPFFLGTKALLPFTSVSKLFQNVMEPFVCKAATFSFQNTVKKVSYYNYRRLQLEIIDKSFLNNSVSFPSQITHLRITVFCPLLENLPSNLQRLDIIVDDFNQPLNKLPNTLITLYVITSKFNQNLNNLPPSLQILNIHSKKLKNHPLDSLPPSLKSLYLFCIKQHQSVFPPQLSKLGIYLHPSYSVTFPPNLVELMIIPYFKNFSLASFNFPPTIKTFRFFALDPETPLNKLPPNLECLSIGNKFNHPLVNLPPTITQLFIRGEFNHPIENLPKNLKKLAFNPVSKFNFPIDNLPPSLIFLKLGNEFDQTVDKLPVGLKVLKFGGKFNKSVDNLPPHLRRLALGLSFDQDIDHLPKTIIHLTLPLRYLVKEMDPDNLPPSLAACTFIKY